MTNKMFQTLVILAVAYFAGQTPQSVAQSSHMPDGIGPIARFGNYGKRFPRKPGATVRASTGMEQDAVAQGKTKTKVLRV